MSDPAAVRRLEEAMLSCWPALSTVFDGSWVIRLSEGHSGRANSITVLDAGDDKNAGQRLAAAAELYRRRGFPAVLRATPLTPPTLLALAEAAGWERTNPTLTMTVELGSGFDGPALAPAAQLSPEWLTSVAAFMGFSEEKRAAVGRKLAFLAPEAGYFLIREADGDPEAALLAALHAGTVGIMDVGVAAGVRRTGLGTRIVSGALAWARKKGARTGWLQVLASNAPAVGLYRRLGFVEAFSYSYYRAPAT